MNTSPALARVFARTLLSWEAEARGELPPLLVFGKSGFGIRNRFNYEIRYVPYDPSLTALRELGWKLEEHFFLGGIRKTHRALRSANIPIPLEPIAKWSLRGANLHTYDPENRNFSIKDWIGAHARASVFRDDTRLNFGGIGAVFEDKYVALAAGNTTALSGVPPSGFHWGETAYIPTALTKRVQTFLLLGQDRTNGRITDHEVRAWIASRGL